MECHKNNRFTVNQNLTAIIRSFWYLCHQWQIRNVWKGGGMEDNVSALPSVISQNAHTVYAFYTRKVIYWKNSASLWVRHCMSSCCFSIIRKYRLDEIVRCVYCVCVRAHGCSISPHEAVAWSAYWLSIFLICAFSTALTLVNGQE